MNIIPRFVWVVFTLLCLVPSEGYAWSLFGRDKVVGVVQGYRIADGQIYMHIHDGNDKSIVILPLKAAAQQSIDDYTASLGSSGSSTSDWLLVPARYVGKRVLVKGPVKSVGDVYYLNVDKFSDIILQ